jgi:cell division septum initiation protein DivIVA
LSEQSPTADVEALLQRAIDIVSNAKSMPLSASVLVSREELLELLEDAMERIPDEMREARWMRRERDEYLEKSRREGERILEAARVQAERMVQRTEIARQAQGSAQRTLERARDEASRLRHEAEDFCDQKLAAFEIVLERTAKMVQAGREKLQVVGAPHGQDGAPAEAERPKAEEAFFDQDVD